MIPRYRQRLATVPLEGHPVWVDDEHFHLDYHVRHVALPHPGSDEQLKALAGRLMSQQLDRAKPLWELNIVEGLANGGFAIITKIHHCMIDGISGIDLMAVILDFAEEVVIPDPVPWKPRPAPNGTELAMREVARVLSSAVANVSDIARMSEGIGSTTEEWRRRFRASMASLGSGWLTPTGKTPLNGAIGPGRSFEWLDLPLAEIKTIKSDHKATVNDVMLTIVAGGVRSYLMSEGGMTEEELVETEFRIMAPVSVRTRDERGTMGNKVAMWLLTLPIGEPDPAKRLVAVREATKELKETEQALGASTIVSLSTGAPATLVSMAARLASRARPFNMTVTNVPGPQFPLYMAGSPMLATYPLVPLWQSHGAGIAMFSVNGSVDVGINMDRTVIEYPGRLAPSIMESYEELLAAPAAVAEEPPRPKAKKMPPMGTR
jgi:WS/DGAT/MGAT family acyltransferase